MHPRLPTTSPVLASRSFWIPGDSFLKGGARNGRKRNCLWKRFLPSEEGVTEPLDAHQQSTKAAAYVPNRLFSCKLCKPCALSVVEKTLPHTFTACHPYSTTVQGFGTEVSLSVWRM